MDIDKAYLMGFEFDNNGKFLGWSPLFNYSNLQTLQMSLTLPTPSQVTFDQRDTGYTLDINGELLNIKNTQSETLKLKYWSQLISKIDRIAINNKLVIKTIDSNLEEEFNKLKQHEEYKIPSDLREDIYKNAVSAKIQQISADPKNMVLSYSPITMDKLRKQANTSSSKGQLMYKLTGLNPATKFIMQKQNMDGKDVIGISAVGEKIFMGLSYYWNEGIRNKDQKWHRRMKFKSTTYRIHNRSVKRTDGSYRPEKMTKYTIADVNWHNIPNVAELQKAFINASEIAKELIESGFAEGSLALQKEVAKRMRNKSQADLMISQLLSAATDNAKELILSKINAGSDFAAMYLHLLILGYDISDIVSFMTSEAVETIASLYELSVFNETVNKSKVEDAVELAMGNINYRDYVDVSKLESQCKLKLQSDESKLKYVIDSILSGKSDKSNEQIKYIKGKLEKNGIKFENLKGYELFKQYYNSIQDDKTKAAELIGILRDVKLPQLMNLLFNSKQDVDSFLSLLERAKIQDKTETLRRYREVLDLHLIIQEIVGNKMSDNDYRADIEEFMKIYKDSRETSNLGFLLGLNRGVKTDPGEFMNQIHKIEQIFINQVKPYIKYEKDGTINIEETAENLAREHSEDADYVNSIINLLSKNNRLGLDMLTEFNLQLFIDNSVYQDTALDIYDLVKSQFNIFDVVLRHENHNTAFNAISAGLQYMTRSSIKGALLNEVRKSLQLNGQYLDNKSFKKIINYCDELLVAKFLKEENISFIINKGQDYYNENFDVIQTVEQTSISLATSHGRASFKKWFEQYFLPQLQNGLVTIGEQTISVDRNNSFLSFIVDGIENGFPIKKLAINMGQVEKSTRVAEQLNIATQGFNALDKQLQDIIMLYTLLVTKNNPGNDRFTSLFSQTFNESNNINYRYSKFLGEWDYRVSNLSNSYDILSEFNYTLNDVQFKLAKIYNSRTIKYAYEPYILYNENGNLVYKHLINPYGYGIDKYSDIINESDLGMFSKSTSLSQRLRNFRDDGVIFLPGNDRVKTIMSQIKSNNPNLVLNALRALISSKLLNITIEC